MYFANCDMNPGYVVAVHCFKAPLLGKRLDLTYLNTTPRFAHRPLLLLALVVVKMVFFSLPHSTYHAATEGRQWHVAKYKRTGAIYNTTNINWGHATLSFARLNSDILHLLCS